MFSGLELCAPELSLLNRTLRITEIFYSLQGETSRVGLPTVFIRLTGCPLRCGYCDTEYAFDGGTTMAISGILAEVARYDTCYVTVTGGEPLAQKNCLALLALLCDRDYSVSLETSGALDVSRVDPRVSKILDIKTPGSGEAKKNLWHNLQYLTPHDEIKFVIASREDYAWARELIRSTPLPVREILMSPALRSAGSPGAHGKDYPGVEPTWLAERIQPSPPQDSASG